MFKSYKYKLKPTDDQIVLLNKHFGSIRFVYNYFLNERKIEYETNKQTLSYIDNAKSLTILKTQENYQWLNEINSQSLQQSLKHLDGAYNSFFKKRSSFPKFKSKHNKNSFKVPQFTKLIKNRIFVPKFKEGIEVILHRHLIGDIKQATISKTSTGEYFVSILVETQHTPSPKTGHSVGVDLGLKDFCINSDGYKYKNNRYTKKYQKKLKKAQQHLSHKKKNSKRYYKQKLKVAKIHKKITNSRIDNLHKISTDLIRKYDLIAVEDLNIKGMVKNHKLAKHISDASWGTFVEMLAYKAMWNDKILVKIDRWFPSSKTCNCCGYINQNLKLDQRNWICPKCGSVLDRDINAAKNILKEGYKTLGLNDLDLNTLSSGTDDHRHGGKIRPTLVGTADEMSKILN